MKKYVLLLMFISITVAGIAQTNPKPKQKEAAPTRKEMADMMKDMQKAADEMSPEDKKMMDSMGIKMPDMKGIQKTVSGLSDARIKKADEEGNRIVPGRDAARIAAIPKGVTDSKMGAYIAAVQNKLASAFKPAVVSTGNKVYDYIKSNSKNAGEAANMAMGLWLAGQPELALYVLGKLCAIDAGNADNLSNYSAMLSMQGAQHLAIPILNNLNGKYPKNSTLLNNLGQAWFGLGEISKAEKYLDSAIRIYAWHPQANMTMAAIEESRGNIEKAKEAVKRSVKHSYSDEKEAKLSKLGHKLSDNDVRLPMRTKNDPLNLGGFQPPEFPLTVDECVTAETEWREFHEQIQAKLNQLATQREAAFERANQDQQQRVEHLIAVSKAAVTTPGTTFQFTPPVPMYAGRAANKYLAWLVQHQNKLENLRKKVEAFMTGEYQSLKKEYEQQMKTLRKEDDEQSGEGKANKDYCPQYKEVSNKYLKTINPRLQQLYAEALKLKKEYVNESAYWNMYIHWPDMFEALKLQYQGEWLATLAQPMGLDGSDLPFESITGYVCTEKIEESKNVKLAEFDDIACQYKSKLDLGIMTFEINCSRMTSKLNLKFIEYTRHDNFERAEGDTYISSTIKVSVEKGFDKLKWEKGPLKLEAKVGASVELELDRTGVKDVILGAEAKLGAGHNTYDKGLEDGGSIGGKDVIDTTIEVGVEGRISLISGHGSVTGSGGLSWLRFSEW